MTEMDPATGRDFEALSEDLTELRALMEVKVEDERKRSLDSNTTALINLSTDDSSDNDDSGKGAGGGGGGGERAMKWAAILQQQQQSPGSNAGDDNDTNTNSESGPPPSSEAPRRDSGSRNVRFAEERKESTKRNSFDARAERFAELPGVYSSPPNSKENLGQSP
jgi:hypothetical protein